MGRPKGSSKPKTVEELLEYKAPVPPRRVKKPKPPSQGPKRPCTLTPELRAKGGSNGAPKGPRHLNNYQWAIMCDEAHKIAKKIMKNMAQEEALPDNPIARKAMEAAIEMLSVDLGPKDRMAAIRTLLEWNLAKPAATSNVNLKTAEDFLDEIADKE